MSVEELIDDLVFEEIFSTPDAIARRKLITMLRMRARELKITNDWDKLLRAHQDEYVRMKKSAGSNIATFTDAPIEGLRTGDWKADDTGVYKMADDGYLSGKPKKVVACSHPIMPVERLVNVDSGREKITLAYVKDQHWKRITVDRTMVASRSRIVDLSGFGIEVTSENARELIMYISECVSLNSDKISMIHSVSHLGWTEDGFAPYSGIRYDGDEGMKPIFQAIRSKGKLKDWTDYVGTLRKRSKILRIQMAASFASPLLELAYAPCFVLHVWGGTGAGKTVGMMVAMSVWGNPSMGKLCRKMDNTSSNFGTVSGFLYSLPFAGDELQEIKDAFNGYDKLVMKVCEGVERGRNLSGSAVAESKTWRNVFIFTGEDSILRAQSGGGVVNRVIEIEATEKIIEEGPAVLKYIAENHGCAGEPYIEAVQAVRNEIPAGVQKLTKQILSETDTTEKQAIPAAIMALADGIACKTFWPDETPLSVRDFYPYLSSKSEVDISIRAYDWTVNWVSANAGRFLRRDRETGAYSASINGEIWGRFEDGNYASINKSILEREWRNQGFDYTAISRQLVSKQLILPDKEGKYTWVTRLGDTRARCVRLSLPKDESNEENDKKVYPDF